MKKVIVTTLHEDEQLLAGSRLQQTVLSDDGLVEGLASDHAIAEMRAAGLLVEELPGPSDMAKAGFTLQSSLRAVSGPLPRTPGLLELAASGPIRPEWLSDLQSVGVRRIDRSGGDRLTAFVDDAVTLTTIAGWDWVCGIRRYEVNKPPVVPLSEGTRGNDSAPQGKWDVRLDTPEDLPSVIAWADRQGFAVVGSSPRRVRLRLPVHQAHLLDDAGLDSAPYVEPTFHNDRACADVLQAAPARAFVGANPLVLSGAGQIVGVADSGLDEQHQDFRGRILKVVSRGRVGDSSDSVGHGTHVAGSILGDGAASGGKYSGMAPAAKLVFQAVADANGGLSGLPVDLRELFTEAYEAGARIHNNSWGSAVQSRYVGSSEDVDDFVTQHPDLLVVISAGNEGSSVVLPDLPSKREPGRVQPLSLGAPATSKNALVVGAVRSSRKQGGLAELTNGSAFANRFPLTGTAADVAAELVSGDVQQLAAFSSRGPCDDRRIKPDVVAPGTDIISARSALAADEHFWAPLPGEPYAYMGGTSMAAPLVSGFAALVREYYVTHRGVAEPSAALLKATIINGTRVLSGGDAGGPIPNEHQGFGCIQLRTTLPSTPSARLAFADVPGPAGVVRVRERRRFTFRTIAPGDLRVCLVFTDPASRSLRNDLDLVVELPGIPRQKLLGNAELRGRLTTEDSENNVEIVRIASAPVGTYTLAVICRNLLQGPQGFAVVVLGELAEQDLVVS
jgi:serine protease AprX